MKDCCLKRKLIRIYEFIYETRRMLILRIKYRLRIMNSNKTLNYIKKNKCSIARFGDGEFDNILNVRDPGFQKCSEMLSSKLEEVLENKNSNLLICIPRCLNTISKCNDHSANFWIEWGKKNNHQQEVINLIRSHTGVFYRFGDSQVTRPYIDWKTDKRAKKVFLKLKELWKERDIIIVEGEQTRLGVGNDLFLGARSIKRIIAPAINAFEYYDQIKKSIEKNYSGELILLALGPTATVLSSDLANQGIQALDMGHIDIEYEWYLKEAKERVPIPGKFTNEAKEGKEYTECLDLNYLSQIIDSIGREAKNTKHL